jgi:hypothetical protein
MSTPGDDRLCGYATVPTNITSHADATSRLDFCAICAAMNVS